MPNATDLPAVETKEKDDGGGEEWFAIVVLVVVVGGMLAHAYRTWIYERQAQRAPRDRPKVLMVNGRPVVGPR